jgi:colanic acid/amylovoran biosynthesis glycosyltransferase
MNATKAEHLGSISNVAPKKLAIILKDYPYKRGEPYFHRELQTLSQHFPEIVLFSRHNCEEGETFHFQVPEGVKVVNIGVRQTWRSKLQTVVTAVLQDGFKHVFDDIRNGQTPVNLLTLKTALAYDDMATLHGKAIEAELLRSGNTTYDFIWYSYWCDEAAYLLAKWREGNRISFAFSRTHGFDIYPSRHPFSYLPYRQFIADHLNVVMCISNHGASLLQERHATASSKFQVAHLGVENLPRMPMEKRKPLKILSLSNIVPIKNLEAIIQGLSAWNGHQIHWHHMGGGGMDEYESGIIRLANEKLGNKGNIDFTFHGFIPPSMVLGKIRELKPHVLVNSSHFEGIPVSMMEVASLGIPIIGPHICGVPEIVMREENGFTFHPIDAEHLLECITRFVELTDVEFEEMCRISQEIQRQQFSASVNYKVLAEFIEAEANLHE